MKLNDLVQHIPHTGASDAEISAITYDSRKAAAGSLFVCLVGAWLDGHTYAASAYKNGCRAFLCEHALDLPADAAQIITADTRAALAVIGALKGQLKQAAQQSAAGGYIREGSFRLDVNADHFLYESTTKRKIENNTQKK